MKKYIVIVFVLAVFQYWPRIQQELSPPPDFSAQHPEGVVLYSTSWCGYCKKTREFFKANNVAYVEYDIEASAEGRSQYDQLHGSGIPLVVIHGEIISGYNPTEMKAVLKL